MEALVLNSIPVCCDEQMALFVGVDIEAETTENQTKFSRNFLVPNYWLCKQCSKREIIEPNTYLNVDAYYKLKLKKED